MQLFLKKQVYLHIHSTSALRYGTRSQVTRLPRRRPLPRPDVRAAKAERERFNKVTFYFVAIGSWLLAIGYLNV